MDGLLGSSPSVFFGLTVLVFGGCGVLTGQTLAEGWKPTWVAFAYVLLLGVGDRFLTWGMFGGELFSLTGFLVHTVVIGAITLTAYRIAVARRMVNQYPWLYERSGPFGWRQRVGAEFAE